MTNNVDARRVPQTLGNDVMGEKLVAPRQDGRGDEGIEEAGVTGQHDNWASREVSMVTPLDRGANYAPDQPEHRVCVEAHVAAVDMPTPPWATELAKPGDDPRTERDSHAGYFQREGTEQQTTQPQSRQPALALGEVDEHRGAE